MRSHKIRPKKTGLGEDPPKANHHKMALLWLRLVVGSSTHRHLGRRFTDPTYRAPCLSQKIVGSPMPPLIQGRDARP